MKPVEVLDGANWHAAEHIEVGDKSFPKEGNKLFPRGEDEVLIRWSVRGDKVVVPRNQMREISSIRPRRTVVVKREEEEEDSKICKRRKKEGNDLLKNKKPVKPAVEKCDDDNVSGSSGNAFGFDGDFSISSTDKVSESGNNSSCDDDLSFSDSDHDRDIGPKVSGNNSSCDEDLLGTESECGDDDNVSGSSGNTFGFDEDFSISSTDKVSESGNNSSCDDDLSFSDSDHDRDIGPKVSGNNSSCDEDLFGTESECGDDDKNGPSSDDNDNNSSCDEDLFGTESVCDGNKDRFPDSGTTATPVACTDSDPGTPSSGAASASLRETPTTHSPTRPSWGTPTWGATRTQSSWGMLSISSEANSSSRLPGSGQQVSVVTPGSRDQGSAWGNTSISGPTYTGWESQSSLATNNNTQGIWGSTSRSSSLRYRQSIQGINKRTPSQYAVQSSGRLEVLREDDSQFFLRWWFGERVKVVEVGVGRRDSLEKTRDIGGVTCTLIASKYEKQEVRPSRFHSSKFGGSPYVKAFYLAENCNGDSAQKELNAIANFSDLGLVPGKLASRLELLVSTAACNTDKNKSPYMFHFKDTSMFEEIDLPENATMGCGFIPCDLLEELLGGNRGAKEAICIRVRFICPEMGIFKGNLVTKPGISKIQLPKSMMKVGKSTAKKKAFKGAFLLINDFSPSKNSEMMERSINPNSVRMPTKSSEKELKSVGPMMTKMLLGCGVPYDLFQEYDKSCRRYASRHHAYLVGVCDCTGGGLPSGSVFVTGFGVGGCETRKVFITRSPCTEPRDAKVVPIVSEKPAEMSDVDWNHICSLPFGAVIFSSPKDATSLSLVESINRSDLDGDLFFCLWEPEMLPYLDDTLKQVHAKDEECVTGADKNMDEFEDEVRTPEQDVNNDLLGVYVPLTIDGKSCIGVVASRTDDGDKYIVKCGDHSKIMTYEDLTEGRAIVQEVAGHRGRGRNAEVEVLWAGGKRSWQSFDLMKKEAPVHVAEYALQSGLLDTKGWCWCKDYIRDAEILSVQSHRVIRSTRTLQVAVLYDGDLDTTYVDAKTVDADILATYVEKNRIRLVNEWEWLESRIKKRKKNWFAAAQERISDIKHMAEYSRFVESLHRAFKKRKDINSKESISFGNAYKRALDIGKHGGRVPLERGLRSDIVGGKAAAYADKFLKDA